MVAGLGNVQLRNPHLALLWQREVFMISMMINPRKPGVCEYLENPGGADSAPPMDFQFRGSQWSYKLCSILPRTYINSFQTFWGHNIHFEVCRMSLKLGRKSPNPIK